MSDLAAFESKYRRLAELREERDMNKKTAETSEAAYREYEAELISTLEESALRGSVEF